MKKLFALAAASLFILGFASAQDDPAFSPPPSTSGTYYQDGASISGIEKITVTIPLRTALHITESAWDLNLDKLSKYDPKTGQGCFLIPKHIVRPTDYSGVMSQTVSNPAAYLVDVYPAVILSGKDVAKDKLGNWLKGGLVCYNRKIVQKFSNNPKGFNFSVEVTNSGATPGLVGIADYVVGPTGTYGSTPNGTLAVRPTSSPQSGSLYSLSGKTTNGFLDDRIDEFIYFDGTETAGTANINVKFTLAGL